MHRNAAIANGALMVLLLAGGAGMSGYVLLTPELRSAITKPLPADDYINGHLTSTIEGDYKSGLPIKAHSVDLLNAFTLSLFNEGRKGVVVGQQGWLFTAEEYAWPPDADANLAANLKHIASVAADLKRRGISLEIALVPAKADVYAGLLSKPRPAEEAGYELVRAQLIAATEAPVPDLRQALSAASTSEEVFFPTDTHWTVAGAGVAAQMVAAAFPSAAAVPEQAFTLKPDTATNHAGDLLNFLELGPFAGLLPATSTAVTPVVAVADSGNVDDFLGGSSDSAAEPQVALVGTSYSAIKLWSFEAQLKAALKRDVLNLAEEGHGPMVPMDKFMQKLAAGGISVKSVIWEVPIRYLGNPPEAVTAKSSV